MVGLQQYLGRVRSCSRSMLTLGDGYRRRDDDPTTLRRPVGQGRGDGGHFEQSSWSSVPQRPPTCRVFAVHQAAQGQEPRAFSGGVSYGLPSSTGVEHCYMKFLRVGSFTGRPAEDKPTSQY